ncbi:MAG: hypothetical protein ACT4P0_11355 [Panacagrimonas sp.]
MQSFPKAFALGFGLLVYFLSLSIVIVRSPSAGTVTQFCGAVSVLITLAIGWPFISGALKTEGAHWATAYVALFAALALASRFVASRINKTLFDS